MRLPPRLIGVGVLFALAVAGLLLPGIPGAIGLYVWLGVFPGLALARLIAARSPIATRWTLGLAFSPLISAELGRLLIAQAHLEVVTAARLIGIASWILWSSSEARRLGEGEPEAEAPPSRVPGWCAFGAVAFAVVFSSRAALLAHAPATLPSDLHASAAWRFVGLLTALSQDQRPFFEWMLGVVTVALAARVAYPLGWAIAPHRRAAELGAVLVTLVMALGVWSLGPGASLGSAWLMLLVFLWAMARWYTRGGAGHLVWAVIAGVGVARFEDSVGALVLPVALGVAAIGMGLRSRLSWLPTAPRFAAFGGAVLLVIGIALAAGVPLSVLGAQRSAPDAFVLPMSWPFLIACAGLLALAARPIARVVRGRSAAGIAVAGCFVGRLAVVAYGSLAFGTVLLLSALLVPAGYVLRDAVPSRSRSTS